MRRSSSASPVVGLAAVALLLLPVLGPRAAAQSNWVNWIDETATRLQITSVPLTDDQEKDMTAGDVDNDGDPDVVIVRKAPFMEQGAMENVLLMNEGGVLVDRTAELIPGFLDADDSRDVELADVNADGWLDIVVANTWGWHPRLFFNLGEDGNGAFLGFAEQFDWITPEFNGSPRFCGVSTGDVTGDGFPDLYFSDYTSTMEDKLLVNDGTGLFLDETDARLTFEMVESGFGVNSVITDMNGDGFEDIVKITRMDGAIGPEGLRLLVNDGTGHFALMQDLPFIDTYMLADLDIDKDGRMDLYIQSDTPDYLLLNDTSNLDGSVDVTNVTVTNSDKADGISGNLHTADLDRDGYIDIGVADIDGEFPTCDRRFVALRNDSGDGAGIGMSDPNNPVNLPWNSVGTHDFAWLDIDQDGFADLFQATCSGYKVFMMEPFAVAEPFGAGCPGINGVPSIGAIGVPLLGNAGFAITLDDAAPSTSPWLLLSIGPASLSTPSGCSLLVDLNTLDILTAPTTDAGGSLQMRAGIPNMPLLEGVRAFVQWAVPDAAGPFGVGWTFSDGLELYLSANTL